ncbi:tRNA pseudouridine(55) synthase TruB [Candidatus Saccharibacteria bacterium]|nr:tRNA pseudouridine(55) synthase TruB [Candidatus Saccharibacteria bacterium]
MDGILLIDKPKNWTSFDVVAKVRGQAKRETGLKKPKVGHTGTLDPLATGLMIVVLGSYCKRAQEFSKLDKVYEVTMKLGQTSTTDDEEGEKTRTGDRRPGTEEVTQTIQSFVGEIQQTPPAFSAIKVNGQRAYKLAREGKEVKMEPRTVMIHAVTEEAYEYPFVRFTAHVSSGTYVRSLVRDIGEKLETGAYMTDLRRASVGPAKLTDSYGIEDLSSDDLRSLLVDHI